MMLRNSNSSLMALAVALLVVGCVGCSDDPAPADAAATEDGTTDAVGDGSDTAADAGVEDVKKESDLGGEDAPSTEDTAVDAKAPVDTGPPEDCSSDQYCISHFGKKGLLSPCTTAKCSVGDKPKCVLVDIVGSCCDDADCNDGATCTKDTCDQTNNKCKIELIPGCCEKKELILDEGFEQKGLGEFTATGAKDNGNVSWHIDPKRHHSGKNALFLGNECYSYDNSQTETNNCTASPVGGQPVFATLTSKSLNLPEKQVIIAHFWLWLKAEPKLTEKLLDDQGEELLNASKKPLKPALTPSEKCSPMPCDPGHTCVKLPQPPKETCDPKCATSEICQSGKCIPAAQCLPENDVLLIYLDVPGKAPVVVWDSSDLASKSTDGWQHVAVNVNKDAAGAKSVQLRWEFRTNNGSLNGFEGVWLDDIRVETICEEVNPPKFKDCTVGEKCPASGNVCRSDACTPYALANYKPKAGVCFYDNSPGCCIGDNDCDDKLDCTDDVCNKAADAKPTDAGTCKNTPKSNDALCCQPANLFKDHFDSGLSGWSHTNASKAATWHHTTKDDAGAGSGALCFGNANCDGYGDKTLKKVDATLCSKVIDIKSGTQYDMLKFNLKMQTEWSGKDLKAYKNPPCPPNTSCLTYKLDHLAVKLKIGGQLVDIWSSDAVKGTTEGKWVPVKVSLDPWQGKKASICFQFDTGDLYANDKGGVWIDDVLVNVTCTEEICTAASVDADCADKPCMKKSCANDGSECLYEEIPGCCAVKADCDDGDECTTEDCTEGQCAYKTDDLKCCKVDKVGDKALLSQDFETKTGELPAGWKFKCLSGAPELPGQQYACDELNKDVPKWYVSTVKAKGDPNANPPKVKSLHFGIAGKLLNVANKAPAGAIESPEFAIPAAGTALLSFDLLLKTEWDKSAGGVWTGSPPPFPIDQLRVELVDVAAKKAEPTAKPEKIWDSYEINGVTNEVWKFILIKVPAKFSGKAVRLRIVFDTGSSGKNQVEGAFVDNVAVEAVCATPACVTNKDCPVKGEKLDECQDYFCGKDDKGAYSCQSTFKTGPDAPKNCCQPKLLLALETAEGQSMNKWADDNFDPDPTKLPKVRWQVVSHKHLFDKFEIYYGNPKTWTYAAGSAKACKVTADCGSGEACTGEVGKKVCLKSVDGKLTSAEITLSASPKEGVELGFHVWADIEPAFETFEVWVLTATGVPIEKVWDHKVDLVPKGLMKKVAPQKVDLSKFKSKGIIKVEFRFDSVDGAKNNLFGGIHLDNLRVDQICLK